MKITLRENFIFGKTRKNNGCEKYPFYSKRFPTLAHIHIQSADSINDWIRGHSKNSLPHFLTFSDQPTLTLCITASLPTLTCQGVISIDTGIDFLIGNLLLEQRASPYVSTCLLMNYELPSM